MGSSSESDKPAGVIDVHTNAEFDEHLKSAKEAQKLVVLQFGTKYSPYCKYIEPAIDTFATETFKDVVFIKIDANELDDLTRSYRVWKWPTFILLKKGNRHGQYYGTSKDRLKRLIEQNIN